MFGVEAIQEIFNRAGLFNTFSTLIFNIQCNMYTYAILEGVGSDPDPPPSPLVNLLKIGFGFPSLRQIRPKTPSLQNNPTNLWIGVHVLHTFIGLNCIYIYIFVQMIFLI